MVLYLIAVGKVKNVALRQACEDYENRARRYVKIEVREVRDGGRTDRDAGVARRKEGEALLRVIPEGARIVALTRTGSSISSAGLADGLDQWKRDDLDVAFIVGGAHGLDAAVLDAAHSRISLSAMTLPHELARLLLLEQLYRACTILRGEPYHKAMDR
jgi:23S rRNA (pseudouridine1915-N3)-methyltransferase